jgi:tetratricopeptide (TPR) repeat protein
MTDTDRLSTLKRLSPVSFVWSLVSYVRTILCRMTLTYPLSAVAAEFEKANEIYFRLGIIYKQQHKYPASLDCFRYILSHPPHPLTEVDIWFQIGHVYEQQKDVSDHCKICLSRLRMLIELSSLQYGAAKDAYERVLKDSPNHAKVLQQLGWLYHQGGASFANQDLAISYLTKSLEAGKSRPTAIFACSI